MNEAATPSTVTLVVDARAVPVTATRSPTAAWLGVNDVMVGGVSLVANYRTEFSNVIRESGIEGLIKNLAAKNRSLAAPEKK